MSHSTLFHHLPRLTYPHDKQWLMCIHWYYYYKGLNVKLLADKPTPHITWTFSFSIKLCNYTVRTFGRVCLSLSLSLSPSTHPSIYLNHKWELESHSCMIARKNLQTGHSNLFKADQSQPKHLGPTSDICLILRTSLFCCVDKSTITNSYFYQHLSFFPSGKYQHLSLSIHTIFCSTPIRSETRLAFSSYPYPNFCSFASCIILNNSNSNKEAPEMCNQQEKCKA